MQARFQCLDIQPAAVLSNEHQERQAHRTGKRKEALSIHRRIVRVYTLLCGHASSPIMTQLSWPRSSTDFATSYTAPLLPGGEAPVFLAGCPVMQPMVSARDGHGIIMSAGERLGTSPMAKAEGFMTVDFTVISALHKS